MTQTYKRLILDSRQITRATMSSCINTHMKETTWSPLVRVTCSGFHIILRRTHKTHSCGKLVTRITFFSVFIYSMPGYKCPIKERMLYSSCKSNLVEILEQHLSMEVVRKVSSKVIFTLWILCEFIQSVMAYQTEAELTWTETINYWMPS